ncbi:MAG TPA: DUF1501 domain-containing protein [Mycobacteriales bacterium]|jgi:uncharacterized protein (DUF1501 family)
MATVSRRSVLKGAGAAVGLYAFSPLLGGAFAAAGPQAAARRRLVVLDLGGGNDGLNTVVPRNGARRAVYDQVRPTIGLPASSLLPLDRGTDDGSMGLHPSLKTLHALYRDDRLAVVQGVDYPNHDYSHFTSNDIWQAGTPDDFGNGGWLGRHLDRVGVPDDQMRAVGIGGQLAYALRGERYSGVQVNNLGHTHFADGVTPQALKRHEVFGRFAQHTALDPLRASYGEMCAATVRLDADTQGLLAAQPGGLADYLLTARTLLTADLGVEVVFVTTSGYDTHATQVPLHEQLLTDLDQALEAFWFGTKGGTAVTIDGTTPIGPLDPAVADRTLVMTFSEFGRRIGENAGGTDHGAAAPMLLAGPPATAASGMRLVPGLHGDHPDVGSTTLPADNLGLTVDMRSVYQAVLTGWLRDENGPSPDEGDPGFRLSGPGLEADGSLAGLFAEV